MSTGQETKRRPKPTDTRDMNAVHILFRREFGALPNLIQGVAPGDRDRVRVVADHVALMTFLVHVHHNGEDSHCWPKLAARVPADAASLTGLMESQHKDLAARLDDVDRKVSAWRNSAAAADRDALAEAVQEVLQPLGEHLDAEEKNMLPLIERYLSPKEWAEVSEKSLGGIPRPKVPVVFGMLMKDADDGHRQAIRAVVPTPAYAVMSRLGPVAYRRYQRKLYPRPVRSGVRGRRRRGVLR